jgi:hypothetical protein
MSSDKEHAPEWRSSSHSLATEPKSAAIRLSRLLILSDMGKLPKGTDRYQKSKERAMKAGS